MNILDCEIIEIYGEPYQPNGYEFWCIDVLIECYGNYKNDMLSGRTKEELFKYKVGDIVYM